MKKLLPLVAATLLAAFLVSVVLSVGFLAGLDQVWAAQAESNGERAVGVLLPSERDPFWDNLVAALRKDAAQRRLVFEVTRYSPAGGNAREVIEKAALSQVDALLCYAPDNQDVSEVINAAEARGMPVLLLENDLPNSHRRVFLGTSSFQVGHDVGVLIRGVPQVIRRAGVLLSQSSRDRQTIRNSLFLNGLNEGLASRSSALSWEEVISPPGRFAGEELVWKLLREEPPVEVLVTTNSKDTLSALQTIVDANRVGKTRLVGVGEDASLRAALDQGLITGLISRDANEWARTISDAIQNIFTGSPVSSYINLPVHVEKPGVQSGS